MNQNIIKKVKEIKRKLLEGFSELDRIKPAEVGDQVENVICLSKGIISELIVQNSVLDAYLVQERLNVDSIVRKRGEVGVVDSLSMKE